MNLSAFHSIGLWLADIISAARGVMVLDGELAAWRRREPDVDHVAADELQRPDDDAVEHRPGDAAVAPDDDLPRAALRQRPRAERRRVARHDFRASAHRRRAREFPTHSPSARHRPAP